MLIAVLNQSTLVDDDDVATMTRAIASQVELDAAPLWDRSAAAVIFYDKATSAPPKAHVITLVDTIKDQPKGVLGYHTEDQGGRLWGVVAVGPELDANGKVLTGDWSVSSVLSHEVLEMFIDPNCNLWSADDEGRVYSFEVCDPVEAPSYEVKGVSVSNFVTPAWFDPLAVRKAERFDPRRVWKELKPGVWKDETPGAGKGETPTVFKEETRRVWKETEPGIWQEEILSVWKEETPTAETQPQFDKLGLLATPFTILPGGYVVFSVKGEPQQEEGAAFPDWRKNMKTGHDTRTSLRHAQGVIV
jgi:hypothetical protein